MSKTKVNLLLPKLKNTNQVDNLIPTEKPRKLLRFFLYPFIFILLIIIVFSTSLLFSSSNLLQIFSGNDQNLFSQIGRLVTASDKLLPGEDQDRINILLVGMGGEGHPGAYLADTIIIVSLKPSTNQAALLSVPRDLYVPIPNYKDSWRKINFASAYGYETNYPGGGEQLLVKTLEPIIGQAINYYVRVDFAGFRQVVDQLGGLDINVAQAFTDYQYPDYNYGWQTISFPAGWQHFDGEKALQYARSRHGCCGEGSDFARSKRQQKILEQTKTKFFSLNTILNPKKIFDLSNSLGNHIRTNIEPWEALRLARLVRGLELNNINNQSLENSPAGLLKADSTVDGAYILRPLAGADNFSQIQKLFDGLLPVKPKSAIDQTTSAVKAPPKTLLPAKVEIYNGTNVVGLAAKIAEQLQQKKYQIVKIANAPTFDYEKTVIYDLTDALYRDELKDLRQQFQANVTKTLPKFFTNINEPPAADFIIILGQDQAINN